jgi:hypothetical protein
MRMLKPTGDWLGQGEATYLLLTVAIGLLVLAAIFVVGRPGPAEETVGGPHNRRYEGFSMTPPRAICPPSRYCPV